MPEDLKAIVNLVKLVFYLLILLNIQACLWYYAVNFNKDEVVVYDGVERSAQWYPPTEWLNYVDNTFYDGDRFKRYAASFYTSLLFLGQNEIGPVNIIEQAVAVTLLVISLIVNVNLFGEVSVLITTISKRATENQNQLDESNSVMGNINLPNEQQDQIREYFLKTHQSKVMQEELDIFLSMLSPSLKLVVQNQIFITKLKMNKVNQRLIEKEDKIRQIGQTLKHGSQVKEQNGLGIYLKFLRMIG